MAIKCKKCKCKVSAAEIIGYVGLEAIKIYALAHLSTKVLEENLSSILLKRSLADQVCNLMTGACDTANATARATMNVWFKILAGAMRQHKLPCPICGTFEGWDPETIKPPKANSKPKAIALQNN